MSDRDLLDAVAPIVHTTDKLTFRITEEALAERAARKGVTPDEAWQEIVDLLDGKPLP